MAILLGMRILFLAPHPFYQDRGTPIAVDLLLRVLSERGHEVHLLTFHEGEDVDYPNVYINRIRRPPFCYDIPPGFSLKKLVSSYFLFLKSMRLRRRIRPDLVHGVEDGAFMASLGKTPFVYDMDSCLSQQMEEAGGLAKRLAPLAGWFEQRAIRKATVVIAVCPALADIARRHRGKEVMLLPDISLLSPDRQDDLVPENPMPGICFRYIGNLQKYQGVEMLVQAFHIALRSNDEICLLVTGGNDDQIHDYNEMILELGIQDHVLFTGPLPVEKLGAMLKQADVVVSPRLTGINTPMKIYSYLDSGKPLLASRLPTHTQVLTEKIAYLADPTPDAFAKAILELADNAELRNQLGEIGKDFAQRFHSYSAFKKRVAKIYGYIEEEIDVRA